MGKNDKAVMLSPTHRSVVASVACTFILLDYVINTTQSLSYTFYITVQLGEADQDHTLRTSV